MRPAGLSNNPSRYSLVILSESAERRGYTVKEYGEADAFGHRKKMSIAEDLSDEIKQASGEETLVSDMTYDLRSGSPDFVDRMVAFTFAAMVMDALEDDKSALTAAINEGRYAMAPIPDPKLAHAGWISHRCTTPSAIARTTTIRSACRFS